MKRFLPTLFALLALTATASTQAQDAQTFTGTIQDFECAGIGHEAMQMGPTDADCVRMCVLTHGVPYVLEVDSATIYFLSDQETPAEFAAQAVTVTGTLDPETKMITVTSIAPAGD
jgi:hypothetical protein